MIPYILRAAVILTVCFLFYKLFLQRATFYILNRWTLLGCLVLSFILPLVPAPRLFSVPATIESLATTKSLGATNQSVGATSPFPASESRSSFTSPHPTNPRVATNSHAATSASRIAISPSHAATSPSAGTNWQISTILLYIYILGLFVTGLKFFLQVVALSYRSFTRPVIRDGRFRIVQTTGDRGPCSFGNTIFINPSLYDRETYQQILVHERTHVSGGHTLDILLAELAVVFLWFNPFVWLYRREVENNLEFLTDRTVLGHPGIERSAYQLSLVRVSAPYLPFSITNNYNQSLLKRRIVMMNSRHSARHTIWKYVVLLPILTMVVCFLNKPAALGQSAATTITSQHQTETIKSYGPRPAADSIGHSVAPTGIATTNQRAGTHQFTAPTAIMDTTVPHSFSDNLKVRQGADLDLRQGSWFVTVNGNNMEFDLRIQDGDNSWHSNFTAQKSEINPFPGQGTVEFKLVRDAGTMIFKGSFDGEQGLGHFQFQFDENYFSEMRKLGVIEIDEHGKDIFFVLNISTEFVRMLNRNGYTPIAENDLVGLAVSKVDEAFLKYWKNSGVEGADQVHNLNMIRLLHIEPSYVEELKTAGYVKLAIDQLIRLKSQQIDGNFIRSMNAGNTTPISPDELLLDKFMHIDSSYINSLKKVGYDHLQPSEIRSLHSAQVTADYIKRFQDAGFSNIPVETLVILKFQNASPEDAKAFRNLGYTDLDPSQMANLQRSGITPEYITAFNKIGYNNIPVNILMMLKMTGVDPAYVAKMKEKGLNSPDLMKYVSLKRDFN